MRSHKTLPQTPIKAPIPLLTSYARRVERVSFRFVVGTSLLLVTGQGYAEEFTYPLTASVSFDQPLATTPRTSQSAPTFVAQNGLEERSSANGQRTLAEPTSGRDFVPGPEYSFRSGALLPWGELSEENALRPATLADVTSVRVPIALELGYRTSTKWWLGVHVEAALGPYGDNCLEDLSDLGERDCQWEAFRVLLRVERHLSGPSQSGFWLGLGAGYESFELRGTIASQAGALFGTSLTLTEQLSGPSLDFDLGYDFSLGGGVRLGPVLNAGVNLFLSAEFDCPTSVSCPTSGGIDDPQLHGWIGLGFKATHGFQLE